MCELSIQELGLERFKRELSHIRPIQSATSAREVIPLLLTCVYQRTRNNSESTGHAAAELAKALNARFCEFEIDALVDMYVKMVSKAQNRELSWESDDLALQNVQARVRVPGVWLLANTLRSLLLTCSNRSEAAVGYATMDGDTAGGLNPIGGIDKSFLRHWLSWMETSGPAGLHSIPALAVVNRQQPSAELRPIEMAQTDESDLMPYTVLNAVELLAIRDKRSPLEVFSILREELKGVYDDGKLGLWIQRFFVLWSVNQWKRERYAPCFHLDDENLDPKTWCRFPILSSGFSEELDALKQAIDSGRS
jgi:NAD+ synthase (glutamine-hydrolysing)